MYYVARTASLLMSIMIKPRNEIVQAFQYIKAS